MADKAIVLPSASLDDYVRTYKLADKFLLKVFRMNGGLFARSTGQVALPIFPTALAVAGQDSEHGERAIKAVQAARTVGKRGAPRRVG